jgi:hypothetical protein
MKYIPTTIAALALCACTTTGQLASKANGPIDPAVTAAKVQQDFRWACFALTGAHSTFLAFQPILASKIDAAGMQTEADAAGVIAAVCAKPLDLTNAQDIIQQVMDAAGRIAAVVAKAQQS